MHDSDVFFDGVQGPLCGGVGSLHGGGCGVMQSGVEDYPGARQHVQDAASTTDGAVTHGFIFSLGGSTTLDS
jgi:hypothetical protein